MKSKSKIVTQWLEDNYYYNSFKTIRAVWYVAKPYLQQFGIDDAYATRIIGQWLWDKFKDGNRTIYGDIGNSRRVTPNRLPIILFCEKNTLSPFEHIDRYIYANSYLSSGQANSYELANLINSIDSSEIWIYCVTDFDKAGDDIYSSIVEKLSGFFTVHCKRLTVKIEDYETYIQHTGDIGLELDAITDLNELVIKDLEEYLPYDLFEVVATEEKFVIEFEKLKKSDDVYQDYLLHLNQRNQELYEIANNYEYKYHLDSNLFNLSDRVETIKVAV